MIASRQQRDVKPIYDKLDIILAKTLGINETIEYSFKPLLDMSVSDKAKVELSNAQADQIYLANGVITPEEVRQKLYDCEVYDINPDENVLGLNSDDIETMHQAIMTATMPNQRSQEEIAKQTVGASTNAKVNKTKAD